MEEYRIISITVTLSLLLLVLPVVTGDDSVKLKFRGQTITSSTLKWVAPNQGEIPKDAVVGSVEYVLAEGITEQDLLRNISAKSAIKEREIYVCRAMVNGDRIPGALVQRGNKSVCVVAWLTQVYERDKYEILQNVDRAARLLWEDWERSREVPKSAVLSGDYFIAHSSSPNFKVISNNIAIGTSFLMGKIEPNLGFFGKMSVVTEDNKVLFDVNTGQVLVEIEPIMYELSIQKLTTGRRKILSRNQTVLGEMTLSNEDSIEMKADAIIAYSWKYKSNWGSGRAMLKGLPTNILQPNSIAVENITWGIPYETEKNNMEKVEAILPAGTATHVQVIGEYVEVEVPYTATLLSIFQDSNLMNRTVHGIWSYTALSEIKTNYGPLYFVHNLTAVPTTTTTTTQPPPTTTTPTTTMTNEIISTTVNQSTKNDHRTKLPVKEDMQSDQSAMQLNNKNEPDKTGSATICLSHSSLVVNSLLISLLFGYIVNAT